MRKEDQNKALENKIRKLATDAIETMGELLRDPNTPAPTKAQVIGFVLERTLGKPDATIHLTTNTGRLQDSENRLIALAQEIREETMIHSECSPDDDEEEDADDEQDEEDDEFEPEE